MSNLTEKGLEDIIIELEKTRSIDTLTLRPTKLFIRPEIVQAIAFNLGITYEEALKHIQQICIGQLEQSE